ncbi:MAG: 30S ribosomal protein S16 [Acidimicrobiia bacterium]|nr:30S ribosomal protein S16 [Acidimicrobiia bacterium]
MAVRIRLTRKGKKKQPTYRVVVADQRSPRDGRYIEQIGFYDPRQDPSVVDIDTERADYWLSNGAQPSAAVRKLLTIAGAVEEQAKPAPKNVHVVGEEAQLEAAAEEEARADEAEYSDESSSSETSQEEAETEAAETQAEAETETEAGDGTATDSTSTDEEGEEE